MLKRLIVFILSALFLASPALAQTLAGRVEAELAAYAADALPASATISIVDMTPVRGHVETVEIIRFNMNTGYFEAAVANGSVQRRITGRAQTAIPLLTPVRTIRSGETVSASDFSELMLPISQAPVDVVADLSDIEGFEARRSLAAGRPVSKQWLGSPLVVARNDIVTVSYNSAHIRLTARARALEEGAVGDVIRAMHVDGKSVIEGVVSGPKLISVN
ncbi:flagellar basal body P-ring formation chaperone FlgA [Hyphococcus sp.]|uniref:flagellar basal body P-ring formation chaperone FlgA n=1 Tax=Hyphococcus sp. TaxID=2038636 RepID=UPI003D1194D6